MENLIFSITKTRAKDSDSSEVVFANKLIKCNELDFELLKDKNVNDDQIILFIRVFHKTHNDLVELDKFCYFFHKGNQTNYRFFSFFERFLMRRLETANAEICDIIRNINFNYNIWTFNSLLEEISYTSDVEQPKHSNLETVKCDKKDIGKKIEEYVRRLTFKYPYFNFKAGFHKEDELKSKCGFIIALKETSKGLKCTISIYDEYLKLIKRKKINSNFKYSMISDCINNFKL